MKEIVVLSGKGGTGKTSITAVFAALMEGAVLVDCDVDAANLHLLLDPVVEDSHEFIAGAKAQIHPERCGGCGVCVGSCRADAIRLAGVATVDPLRCEGCGVCAHVCPSGAVTLEPRVGGRWYVSRTAKGPLFHARLAPGLDNSGKLVSTLRHAGRERAEREGARWLLVDGPPGSGCPVISSLTGADYVALVTEPTVSGYSDLQRAAAIADHFRVPTGVLINKVDLNSTLAARIEEYVAATGRDLLGRIAYDAAFTKAQRAGVPALGYASVALRSSLEGAWRAVAHAVLQGQSLLPVLG
jgi:MinD superfamily P-loop ATPase